MHKEAILLLLTLILLIKFKGSVSTGGENTENNENGVNVYTDYREVTIPENVPIGTTLLRVSTGIPNSIVAGEYKFTPRTLRCCGNLFGINQDTGDIFVKSNLDYEERSMFVLKVTVAAENMNSTPSRGDIIVRVILLDLNDNPPLIRISTHESPAEVAENSKPGTFVAHVRVYDPDSKNAGLFDCLIDNDQFALINMYDTEYKITTMTAFDRERQSEHHLKVLCTDKGSPPLSATAELTVVVFDKNDNAPRFHQKPYYATITENNAVGEIVTKVTAQDMDAGRNGDVRYSMMAYDQNLRLLAIDERTGEIRAKVTFDREQYEAGEFLVAACDMGFAPQCTFVRLFVVIRDVNDNAPVFTKTVYVAQIPENNDIGASIITAKAYDPDSAPYNEVRYSLKDDNQSMVTIDERTGEIYAAVTFDYEQYHELEFEVEAHDLDDPSLHSVALVRLMITDVNDEEVPVPQ